MIGVEASLYSKYSTQLLLFFVVPAKYFTPFFLTRRQEKHGAGRACLLDV